MNATFEFKFTVEHHQVARAAARVEKIDLMPDVQGIVPPVSKCSDVTTIVGNEITRTVKLLYSPEFEQAYPTENDKVRELSNFGYKLLSAQVPYRLPRPRYTVTYWVLNNDCP
jgi:hypothetical protein